jgi:hypothetical protein
MQTCAGVFVADFAARNNLLSRTTAGGQRVILHKQGKSAL